VQTVLAGCHEHQPLLTPHHTASGCMAGRLCRAGCRLRCWARQSQRVAGAAPQACRPRRRRRTAAAGGPMHPCGEQTTVDGQSNLCGVIRRMQPVQQAQQPLNKWQRLHLSGQHHCMDCIPCISHGPHNKPSAHLVQPAGAGARLPKLPAGGVPLPPSCPCCTWGLPPC